MFNTVYNYMNGFFNMNMGQQVNIVIMITGYFLVNFLFGAMIHHYATDVFQTYKILDIGNPVIKVGGSIALWCLSCTIFNFVSIYFWNKVIKTDLIRAQQ